MDFGIDSGVMFMSPVVKTSGAACSAVPVHIYLITVPQNGRSFFDVNRMERGASRPHGKNVLRAEARKFHCIYFPECRKARAF